MPSTGVIAFTLAATFGLGMPTGIDVGTNDSNNSVVLRGKEVRDGESHRRPFHHRKSGPRAADPVELKSPCTYNGLLFYCPNLNPQPIGGTVFTPGLARQAVMNIPLPGLELHVQPDGETLVNIDTIFYVKPEPFSTSIDLLGHSIEVEATPEGFTWVHGDGTVQSTDEPGHPYPSHDITHRYEQPARVDARVDTTYSVRYSIDGGGWTDLGEPLTAAGPATPVDVHEAAPVLAR